MEFDQFVRERGPSLLRFATALCADRGLGEDVVQDVLLRVHDRWSQIEHLASVDGYVHRMVVNEYLSWRRRWARIIPHAVVPASGRTSPDHAESHAARSELAARLAGLPPKQRAVLVMRYYGDLPDADIAEALGCRAVTVRGYASRGLATLRIDMTGHPDPVTKESP